MKKKILVLTPRFPYPVIGGDRLRIYYICKELSKTYDLTLLSLCETQIEMEMDIQDGVFGRIERILLPKWKSYLNCLFALPTSKPLQVAYYSSHLFQKKLESLIPSHDFALAHLIRTGHYLKDISIPKVLEMTDAISMNYERIGVIAKSSSFKNFVFALEQKRLKVYEKQIAKHFNFSVFVSQVDKDYLFPKNDPYSDKVLVCSNGVDLSYLPFNYMPDAKTIVFIGNMNTVQNLDAARWFAINVMPELLKLGKYRFKVIGRISDKVLKEFNGYPGTIATGGVDSVADASLGAIVGVCPMRLGAGVQNKILEYMALGMPAITSCVGLEGIEASVNKEILVADLVDEYVSHITNINKDNDWGVSIGQAGYEYVRKSHSWEEKLAPYVMCINDL
jgi:glycosyltransferase involved in cell wall biosynthesis